MAGSRTTGDNRDDDRADRFGYRRDPTVSGQANKDAARHAQHSTNALAQRPSETAIALIQCPMFILAGTPLFRAANCESACQSGHESNPVSPDEASHSLPVPCPLDRSFRSIRIRSGLTPCRAQRCGGIGGNGPITDSAPTSGVLYFRSEARDRLGFEVVGHHFLSQSFGR